MAFAMDDLPAMLSDFGSDVEFRGVRVGLGTVQNALQSSADGVGMMTQRSIKTLRVVSGALDGWTRDDVVTHEGKRWRIRSRADNPQDIDGAYDVFEVGAA
jgi:hypothetical protein